MEHHVLFFILAASFVAVNSWIIHLNDATKCPATPDYSDCRLNMPCNPTDVNPCGCPHACCAATKTYYIARGSNGEQRGIKAINHTSLHFSTHYCFKKGECNQLCGGVWSLLNNVDKCGCGEGLKCSFDVWQEQLRCSP